MPSTSSDYIERRLLVDDGADERVVAEADVLSLGYPLIVLGDPGMGKTRLMQSIAQRLCAKRISAGSFSRVAELDAFKPTGENPIIIDGLDELVVSSGASAVDDVLKRLSALQYPPFILSCRAADWNGSADRHKIREDYGKEPISARLEPFSRDDAARFLTARKLDAKELLDGLDHRDLDEFYKNPLTLTLIAEIAADKQGLPSGRAELLERASHVLLREENAIHQRDEAGLASSDDLLDSAGAIFAHLLLSGSLGVADLPSDMVPAGFVAVGEITVLPDAPLTQAALKTRLFQGGDEKLFVPYHRVIAEFLAARWLAKRLDHGLSPRRLTEALTFAGGVPTALRGVHAWLAHFAPRLAEASIRIDPFGALRYGDPERLPLPQARLLLQSLNNLAKEDPYFRSEDWGRHAITGLARPELKSEILDILKRPDRHVHLSSIVLEALAGSPLTRELATELSQIIEDEKSAYIERRGAADALAIANVPVDWPALVRALRAKGDSSSKRLAVEFIGKHDAVAFTSADVADAILDFHGIFTGGRESNRVLGADHGIPDRLSPEQAGDVLDEIVKRVAEKQVSPNWRMGYSVRWVTLRTLLQCNPSGG